MREPYEISISFDTDDGVGNIAIVHKFDGLLFKYTQLGGGTLYHNAPIDIQSDQAMATSLRTALKEPCVWGVRRANGNVPREWVDTLKLACKELLGIAKRIQEA